MFGFARNKQNRDAAASSSPSSPDSQQGRTRGGNSPTQTGMRDQGLNAAARGAVFEPPPLRPRLNLPPGGQRGGYYNPYTGKWDTEPASTSGGGAAGGPWGGALAINPGMGLAGTFRVSGQPEYVFSEESRKRRRSLVENLTYYTGSGCLGGGISGGIYGAYRGAFKHGLEGAAAANTKLRTNAVINHSTKSGTKWGTTLGSILLIYTIFESGIMYARDGEDDALNQFGAGVAAGAIFKSPAGLRAASVAGVLGGAIVGVVELLKDKNKLVAKYA